MQENAVLSLTTELERVGGGVAAASDQTVRTSSDGGSATEPQDYGSGHRRPDRITSYPATGVDHHGHLHEDFRSSESETQVKAPVIAREDVQV